MIIWAVFPVLCLAWGREMWVEKESLRASPRISYLGNWAALTQRVDALVFRA